MRESCAVIGIYSGKEVFNQLYLGLYAQQHRGQESAGIATSSKNKIHLHRDMGLVVAVFKYVKPLPGTSGIGHTRYSTYGNSENGNSQPLVINYGKGSFAIAHNGNLVNCQDVKKKLERKGCVFSTQTDTEVIAQLFAQEHLKAETFVEAIKNAMKTLEGAYSLTILRDNGEIIGVRDPWGFRPLILGKFKDGLVVTSESCALDILGIEILRDVEPGEIVVLNENGLTAEMGRNERHAHCIFEFVYFARPDSIIEGISVYQARKNLGKNLWEEQKTEADLVTAVPDSGITAAIGYSEASGIPYGESLMKNRYTGRTFIMPRQEERDLKVKIKLNPISSEVKGKDIILIDDSIVRGTTIRNLISLLKKAGAKKVHVRITCPPLKNPCFYGVDMKTHKEFAATNKTVEEIEKQIGADTLKYNSLEGMVKAVDLPKERFCLACFTGQYPIKEKQVKLF